MNYFDKWRIKHAYQAEERKRLLENFKNDPKQKELRIPYQRFWGGTGHDVWKKRTVALKDNQSLDILTNQNINHDTVLLLHTNGATVKKITRKGELKPQALTGAAIRALGYNKKHDQRLVKSRIVSVLDDEKQNILKIAHDRISHLQEIERFIGHRIHNPEEVSLAMVEALERYQNARKIDQFIPVKGTPSDHLDSVAKADIMAAEELKKLLWNNRSNTVWLETIGYEKLFSFVQGRALDALRQSQAYNQILTHRKGTGAYFRGDFNSFVEDAVKVTRDHQQDLHNPITRDHQLAYEDEKQVTVDSSFHTDSSRDQLDDLLLAISTVSGDNSNLEKLKGPVKVTSATKWLHWRSFMDSNPYNYSLFHSAKHFFGTLGNVLLSPLNLIETIIRGERAEWVASLLYVAPENPAVKGKTDYYALMHRVKQKASLTTKIGLTIHKTLSHFLWEGIAKGIYDGLAQISRLPADLLTDFKSQESTPASLLASLDFELKTINKEIESIKASLELKGEHPAPAPYYAQPAIPLDPYHSHGVLNGLGDGVESFVDLFGHHMFAKHPFTATVSSVAAAASFMAFFATPTAVSIMGKGYVNFLLNQGYIWTKDPLSASLAGAFTNFKLVGAVIEGVENGPDSWLSKFVTHIAKDPGAAAAYATMAWLIGHAVVYQLDVPGISATLRSHIGYPPALSEFFGGLKISVGGYHLTADPQKDIEELRTDYIEFSIKTYKAVKEKQKVAVTAEEEAELRANLNKMVSAETIQDFKKGVLKKFANMSVEEKAQFSILLKLAANRHQLDYLSPVLKAKIEHALPSMIKNPADARAIEKFLDPKRHNPKSTLRSFLGRALAYIPVGIRCVISPVSGLIAFSLASFMRPWRELGRMLLDDITSTFFAISRLTNKVLETVFNRLPRTLADIVVNGIVARTASFFGYHKVTTNGYQASASWDKAQQQLYGQTTGNILNKFVRENTTPHPEIGLQNAIQAKIQVYKTEPKKSPSANTSTPNQVAEQPALKM